MRFKVFCDQRHKDAVQTRLAHAKAQARLWEQSHREWARAAPSAVERTRRKEIIDGERARLIERGQLARTQSEMLRAELKRYIAEQGWDQQLWGPVPDGVSESPGRRWGTATQRWTAAIHVEVDDATAELIRRVAYGISQQPTRLLQQWSDQHRRQYDRGPGNETPEVTKEQLRERDRLRSKIKTTASILREVIIRAGSGYGPPRADEPSTMPTEAAAHPAGSGAP